MKETIAPCGMDCELCHSYQNDKKKCPGCRNRSTNCVIRNCDKRQSYCFECTRFPCKRLQTLDTRYHTKYGMGMLDNLTYIREYGEEAFLSRQAYLHTCPDCGKLKTVHYDDCIYCKQLKRDRMRTFQPPASEELLRVIGEPLHRVWTDLCRLIEQKYEMEKRWNHGGKAWKYECKYRKGGKTLCALYAKENNLGFMIILGKEERTKFEFDKESYSTEVRKVYEETKTYHDGKWLMFELKDTSLFPDMEKLLYIKRRPTPNLKESIDVVK